MGHPEQQAPAFAALDGPGKPGHDNFLIWDLFPLTCHAAAAVAARTGRTQTSCVTHEVCHGQKNRCRGAAAAARHLLPPPPHDQPCRARERRRLGDAAGLTQFGVNLLTLPPGVWSSQRHWHLKQDEFIYILSGDVVLVTNAGEETLTAGDCAGFKGGDEDGHHFVNRSGADATLLEMGTRVEGDSAVYPDIDMVHPPGGVPALYTHKDGTAYPDIRWRTPQKP